MEPTREELAALARQLAATTPDEIDCESVLDRVAAYLERHQDAATLPPELAAVGRHLEVCPSCADEFEALLRAVAQDEPADPPSPPPPPPPPPLHRD